MSVAHPTASGAAMPVQSALRQLGVVGLTVEQYARMVELGIVPEDASVELLGGALIEKDRGTTSSGSMRPKASVRTSS